MHHLVLGIICDNGQRGRGKTGAITDSKVANHANDVNNIRGRKERENIRCVILEVAAL